MIVVSLCKPVIHKLKSLGRGKLEYYKSLGEPQKGGSQISQVQWGGKQKQGGGATIFYSNLAGGNYAFSLPSMEGLCHQILHKIYWKSNLKKYPPIYC